MPTKAFAGELRQLLELLARMNGEFPDLRNTGSTTVNIGLGVFMPRTDMQLPEAQANPEVIDVTAADVEQ